MLLRKTLFSAYLQPIQACTNIGRASFALLAISQSGSWY